MRVGYFLVILIFFVTNSYALPTYQDICLKLPDQSSWIGGTCEGMNMQGSPMGDMVTANRIYTKGDKKVEVMVVTGMAAASYNAQLQQRFQVETNDEFVKVMDVDGYMVAISYYKAQNNGGIVVPINSGQRGRDITAVIVFNYENMNWKDALDFAKKFSWKDIERLFKK